MDVRLTTEQQQLRDAAAALADDLGPESVAALEDESRIARLDKQLTATGFRTLRSDEASGVEVAIVARSLALHKTVAIAVNLAFRAERSMHADIRGRCRCRATPFSLPTSVNRCRRRISPGLGRWSVRLRLWANSTTPAPTGGARWPW